MEPITQPFGDLRAAVRANDVEAVRTYFENGNRDRVDGLALRLACKRGNTEIARLVLAHGANVNAPNSSGDTAILNACFYGHAEIVRLLLEAGADFGQQRRGYTPLSIACQMNNVECALLCIRSGSNVDLANDHGMTPLHVACRKGCAESVNLLLHHGASMSLVNRYGELPLHVASRSGACSCARALLDHGDDIMRSTVEGDMERSRNRGALPLHRACAVRSKSTTRLFLKRGGNPYVTDRYGHTAFDYANGRAVPRMLRKFLAVDIRLCVLGTAAEYPQRNRLRDLIPHIASFIV